MNIYLKFFHVIFFATVLSHAPAFAQDGIGDEGAVFPDLGDIQKRYNTQELSALTNDLAGDHIDIDTGALSFTATDVSLPGNNGLAVEFTRALSRDRSGQKWGDWVIGIPSISRNYVEENGANLDRCTGDLTPSSFEWSAHTDSSIGNGTGFVMITVTPESYWSGYNLKIPGRSPGKLGGYAAGGSSAEFAGTDARMVTKENWLLKCGVTADDGGEGYKVVAPNGDTYTFDRVTTRYVRTFEVGFHDPSKASQTNPSGPNESRPFQMMEETLLVSKVTDVHGNTVTYSDTGIISSDGRSIAFGGTPSSRTVTANGRVWTYKISGGKLTEVTQPDGRKWLYNVPSDWLGEGTPGICANYLSTTLPPITVTHPSGTQVQFDRTVIKNGRTYMDVVESEPGTPHPSVTQCHIGNPNYVTASGFYAWAITDKTITLSDGTSYAYGWDYEEDSGSHHDASIHPADTKKRTVTDPLGNKTVYHFNRRNGANEGNLEKVEIIPAGATTPIQTTTNTYQAGHMVGADFSGGGPTNGVSTRRMYKTATAVQRDGETTTTQWQFEMDPAHADFAYNQPKSTSTFSTVSPTPRVTEMTYTHKTPNWILSLPETVKRNGVETAAFIYDAKGQKTAQSRFGQANFATFGYNPDGTLAWFEDALNRRTEALNWKRGTAQTIIQAVGSTDSVTTEQIVDDNGWLTSVTDGKNQTTSYTHDPLSGRVTTIDPPGDFFSNTDITYTFPPAGGAVQTVTKGGALTTITYDSMFRPVLKTTSLDGTDISHVNTSYDALGRAIFTSQPSLSPTETKGSATTYDALGRAVETRVNGDLVSTTTYHSGHETRVTDAKGDVTSSFNNGHSELIEILQPEGIRTQIFRDGFGKPTRLRQSGAAGYAVDHSQYLYYDAQQRLCRHHVPEAGSKLYGYNDAGELTDMNAGMPDGTDCGLDLSHESYAMMLYTELGQLRATLYPNSPETQHTSYQYDDNGNRTFAQRYRSGKASVRQYYGYNELDLPTTGRTRVMADAADGTPQRDFLTDREYTPEGHLARRMLPGARWMDYNPDALGRMGTVSATGVGDLALSPTYHPNGAVKRFDYGDGAGWFTQDLDARQRPLRLRHKRVGVPVDLNYGYDANSRITSILDYRHHNTSNPRDRHFTYDGAGRLTLAESDDPLHGDISYTYDALGNLRTKDYLTGQWAGRNLTLAYNGQNQLTYIYDTDANGDEAWTGTRWTAHDLRGNIQHYGHLHLVHDMTNQPIGMFGRGTGSNGSDDVNFGQQAHLYDANKRRVKTVERTSAGVITGIRYNIFDAAGTLVQVYNATTDTKTDYVSGPNGALARIKRHAGTDTTTFIHADHLGTARSGTGWGGQELWEDYHTPFGESLIHPDATDDQGDYTGHIRDRKTGLTYMQARYQDPLTGRFLSEDPVGMLDKEMNPGYFGRYGYTFNDPINLVDPNGEHPVAREVGKKAINKPLKNAAKKALGGGETASTVVDVLTTDFTNPAEIGGIVADKALGKVKLLRRNSVRGNASEKRVLDDLGLDKNTTKVSSGEGNSIPDVLTDNSSIEIKDTKKVCCTRQVRIQTEAAAASGRESILVTGTKTDVNDNAEEAFDLIIRRDDLGPQQ